MRAYIKDQRQIGHKPVLLLYSSCVAEQVRDFLMSSNIRDKFYVDVVLIHNLELDDVTSLVDSQYRGVFERADVIATNCFSPKWKGLGLEAVESVKSKSCPVFVWTPPNFAAFWPVVEGFGEHGVRKLFRSGASLSETLHQFDTFSFDCCFAERMDEQIKRLEARDETSHAKIAPFLKKWHRSRKLWFTENHPCHSIVAWISSQLISLLGETGLSETECADLPHDAKGIWNAWPETRYEWGHFMFEYPIRYETTIDWGGMDFYRLLIRSAWKKMKQETL